MKTTKKGSANQKPLIILTAGGTGGHVYPAESLADELLHRGYRVELITDKRGKDNYQGRLGEIPNHAVYAGALVGKSKLFKIKSLIKTMIGTMQAAYILFRKKPVCVVGFGGYASFPCSMGAILLGVNLVIHEQNSVMSRTNRFLSKYADLIAQSFKKVKYTPIGIKSILTGMPIRKAIAEIRDLPYPPLNQNDKFQIMIMGGSQGAKIFGDLMPEVLKNLPPEQQKKIRLFQQCRQADVENLQQTYKDSQAEITVSHFFNNMPELYAQTHLIISRAGASSVSEFAAIGLPSILVPLPIAADDHQTSNAKEIADAKAGIVIKQKDFTSAKLQELLNDLMKNHDKLQLMSDNAKQIGIINAAQRFADSIEQEIISKP